MPRVICPMCGDLVEVTDRDRGLAKDCPNCGEVFRAPGNPEAEAWAENVRRRAESRVQAAAVAWTPPPRPPPGADADREPEGGGFVRLATAVAGAGLVLCWLGAVVAGGNGSDTAFWSLCGAGWWLFFVVAGLHGLHSLLGHVWAIRKGLDRGRESRKIESDN